VVAKASAVTQRKIFELSKAIKKPSEAKKAQENVAGSAKL
jgi:hypothetical protein